MPTAVISTMGTSLLTNGADGKTRDLLRLTANKKERELSAGEKRAIEERAAEVAASLDGADLETARALSAEINGLLAATPLRQQDCHYLLHTDTFQGQRCTALAAQWLRANGGSPVEVPIEHLTVGSAAAFARGVDSLLRWMDDTVRPLRQSGWRVIFNLVGGFKALHAYAHTLGMFYADELVYLFEGEGAEAIRIPRLPVRLDDESLADHAAVVARMAEGEVVPRSAVQGLQETYLDVDGDGSATLTEWGRLLWLQRKRDLLSGLLLAQPGIAFGDSFRKDYDRETDVDKKVKLQETIAKVSEIYRRDGLGALRRDGGLLYEDYADKRPIGHFRVTQGLRVSCEPREQELLLRRYGMEPVVNKNP